ncbi:hypothetical protein ILYODFUR_015072 [Ilyodon furcidens]|uniref:Uncharacterized protein n=1 Tax=Ilyodon furcidens TaxID=33524 RepID=A0ABV0U5J5_9TELE
MSGLDPGRNLGDLSLASGLDPGRNPEDLDLASGLDPGREPDVASSGEVSGIESGGLKSDRSSKDTPQRKTRRCSGPSHRGGLSTGSSGTWSVMPGTWSVGSGAQSVWPGAMVRGGSSSNPSLDSGTWM